MQKGFGGETSDLFNLSDMKCLMMTSPILGCARFTSSSDGQISDGQFGIIRLAIMTRLMRKSPKMKCLR